MQNKLQVVYKKKMKAYLLIDAYNNVIWQFNLNYMLNNNNKNLKLSKNMKKYIFFMLNISIFGLSPFINSREIRENNV
jgi:hypothetical protein